MTTTDARPGTVPAWCIRYAYDGEEWLVLGDLSQLSREHTCNGGFMPFDDLGESYETCFTTGWGKCKRTFDCPAILTGPYRDSSYHDSLAEAHAAFERIEQVWRERER